MKPAAGATTLMARALLSSSDELYWAIHCHLTAPDPPPPRAQCRRITAAVQQEPERRIDPNLTDAERQRQVTPLSLVESVQ